MMDAAVLRALEPDLQRITMREVVDLKSDGANVFAFCSKSRQLFVSHPVTNTKLNQWDIDRERLLFSYTCPSPNVWWDEAIISPDGHVLVASTYPANDEMARILVIDTATHKTRFTLDYKYPVRSMKFDATGNFIWVSPTSPGPDPFVYDLNGKKHSKFNKADFVEVNKAVLWDVPNSKGGPPPGLFYKNSKGNVHHLIANPLNQCYAISKGGQFIGTSTWDQRVRIWRTFDLKEEFDERIGAHAVRLLYDSVENQFLVIDGIDGNTHLRAIKLPSDKANRRGQPATQPDSK